ncbi:MAG: DEAD/DEAH box helicase [Acidobacteriaceae bacterium]
MKQFLDLPISQSLQKAIAALNFTVPTPVQAGAIPPALAGRDVLATAQTGTGKTLSFLVPVLEQLGKPGHQDKQNKPGPRSVAALIMLPTRELAMQVHAAYGKLSPATHKRDTALVVGGLAEGDQIRAIRNGARVVIATPGRLEDLLKRRLVRLDAVEIFILDEVDRMLDMGFQPAIRRIAALLPRPHQTLCYSATLESPVREIVQAYLTDPVRVEVGDKLKPAEHIELRAFSVETDKKVDLLKHLLQTEKGSCLVFVRTKHGTDRLGKKLVQAGLSAAVIHGDRSQSQRNSALQGFTQKRYRVLVATDVAARGIDVPNIAHVVNFDLPQVAEDFVHRVGRTGRASASGMASTFFTPEEKGDLRRMERTLGLNMDRLHLVEGAVHALPAERPITQQERGPGLAALPYGAARSRKRSTGKGAGKTHSFARSTTKRYSAARRQTHRDLAIPA